MKYVYLITVFFFSTLSLSFAETIHLKTGHAVEGKILEKTDDYVKFETLGLTITYYNEEIESIDVPQVIQQVSVDNQKKDDAIKQATIAYYLEEGINNVKEQKLDAAVEQLLEVIKLQPDNFDAHFYLGLAYGNQGQMDQAIYFLEQARQLRPDSSEIYTRLGGAYTLTGKTMEGMSYYQKAVDLDPNNSAAYKGLADYYVVSLGEYQQAVPHLKKAVELDPNSADLHYNLGIVLMAMDQYDSAQTNLLQAVKLNPQYAEAYFNLGIMYANLGQSKNARANLAKAKDLFEGKGNKEESQAISAILKDFPRDLKDF